MFYQESTANTQRPGFGPMHQGCHSGHWGKKFREAFGEKAPWMRGFGNRKAANIEETDTAFTISLYAAGLSKEAFNISVNRDVLTIRYTAPEQGDGKKYIHQEYQPASFERSFQLNNLVTAGEISAAYTDGVLKVTLPKNPETNQPAQDVKVS